MRLPKVTRKGLRLSEGERLGILAGEHPAIIRAPLPPAQTCPFVFGEQVALRSLQSESGPVPQVWITIIGRRRGKKGEWIALYSVRDDRPLYLAPGSGYTSVRYLSPDPDVDVMDETLHRRIHGEIAATNAAKRAQARKRTGTLRLEGRLEEARLKHWASTIRYLERVQRHHERKNASDRAA